MEYSNVIIYPVFALLNDLMPLDESVTGCLTDKWITIKNKKY